MKLIVQNYDADRVKQFYQRIAFVILHIRSVLKFIPRTLVSSQIGIFEYHNCLCTVE